MNYRVEVDGVPELDRRLGNVDAGLSALRPTNRRAAAIAGALAEAMAPKRTGMLAASVRAYATDRAGVITFGGPAVPYAGPIEWGDPFRPNPATGQRGGPIRASHFASLAAQRTQPLWTEQYRTRVLNDWNR